MENSRPLVGVGVMIKKGNKVLLLKRSQNVSHGRGQWYFPGGHLEFWESPEKAAKREVWEETGLRIRRLKFASYSNNLYLEEKKHYVTLIFQGEHDGGELQIKEPAKCTEMGWFDLQKLPSPLFPATKMAIECLEKKVAYLPS